MMAASTLVVVPSIIFFMFIQRKIAAGMTDGSVK
ncbi:MAG: carbohydrate ABC transporter permease, partial [Clostridium sp.]|nr:carbohydrate ABC transporter permease [Clostridium sp.]